MDQPFVRLKRAAVAVTPCLMLLFWWLSPMEVSLAQPVVTLDPATRFQTIQGWEAVAWAAQDSSPAYPQYQAELMRRTIVEAGVTRVRLEVRSGAENATDYWTLQQSGQIDYATWRANRYATVNDNADPFDLRPEGFHFSELDNTVGTLVLPLRAEAELNGVDLIINLNYVAFTGQIMAGGSYEHADPEEYAEFMLALFQHLDQRYGFVPDAVEILLEPDNVTQWNGNLIGRVIVATAARLRAAGYDCEFIAPSCTNMGNAVRVERSAAPADPGSWVEVQTIDMAGLRIEWSDAWSPAAFGVYYRVVFR